MKIFLASFMACWLLAMALPVSAQTVTNEYSFSVNETLPDDEPSGLASSQSLNTSIYWLTRIQVLIDAVGGFNGDLYAHLSFTNHVDHTSGFSVLLNRAGVTGSNPDGYGDSGFNVTFDDTAANGDIHTYRNIINPGGGVLTGLWQPDARNIHPTNVLDTTPRTADLSSFTGFNPNGTWTLFLVDNAGLNEFVVNSWSIRLIGVVPEPGTYALMSLGAGIVFWRMRKKF